MLPGVRLKDETAQPGRQGPLFPQLCRRCLGNTVVGDTAEKALGRGRPAVGVECGVLVLHPEQPGLAPTFQGMEGTGFSSDASVIEHQLYTGEQNRLCGSRGCSVAGRRVPLSAPAEVAAAGFLTAGRGISGWSRSASSHHLFPTLTHSSAGTGPPKVTRQIFQLKFGTKSLPPLSQDAPRGNLIDSAHL